ncbi:calcium-binding protein [Consotaella aegiceratis]|uniref:calcium-binding protein n=1 Tax=Consotaella aegiceratis TaxID=3097961 RepID=UPI002F3EAFB3
MENLIGSNFNDVLGGDAGGNVLQGLNGNDVLAGRGGNDVLLGGAGNDVLNGGTGADRLDGGAGLDTASYAGATAAVTADLLVTSNNTGDAVGDIYISVENLIGTGFSDVLLGDAGGNVLQGLNGNDVLAGRGGNDVLLGGDGNDVLNGGVGADRLDGGAGLDTASYAGSTIGLTADFLASSSNTGEAAGDVYVAVENLIGSNFNDVLGGDAGGNVLQGLNGNDVLAGRGGNDVLLGGAGNDVLNGGTGADRLDGGAGLDTASYAGATAGVTADFLASSSNTGEAAGDVYVAVENLIGTGFSDVLLGDAGGNVLQGLNGNDVLAGRGGNDVLLGGAGNDILFGGIGADTLNGGAGSDIFTFQAIGESTVAAATRDTIQDFVRGQDVINLSAIDANTGAAGDQAFTYIGAAAFTGVAGQLRFAAETVYGDVNGDGIADFAIEVNDTALLTADDFTL